MPGTMLKSEDKNENKSNNLVKESKKLKIVVNMVTQDERNGSGKIQEGIS